ncbi:translation initiation factor IF-2-like [Lontra canadensis]|uniref:translation initiation factor IF-2-like n=1 Tax=Lontra canadensis TaxID=76717 RepID=UPI0013F35F6A|nr:translation initiation factor IF-2-like [Lontra canadensis]
MALCQASLPHGGSSQPQLSGENGKHLPLLPRNERLSSASCGARPRCPAGPSAQAALQSYPSGPRLRRDALAAVPEADRTDVESTGSAPRRPPAETDPVEGPWTLAHAGLKRPCPGSPAGPSPASVDRRTGERAVACRRGTPLGDRKQGAAQARDALSSELSDGGPWASSRANRSQSGALASETPGGPMHPGVAGATGRQAFGAEIPALAWNCPLAALVLPGAPTCPGVSVCSGTVCTAPRGESVQEAGSVQAGPRRVGADSRNIPYNSNKREHVHTKSTNSLSAVWVGTRHRARASSQQNSWSPPGPLLPRALAPSVLDVAGSQGRARPPPPAPPRPGPAPARPAQTWAPPAAAPARLEPRSSAGTRGSRGWGWRSATMSQRFVVTPAARGAGDAGPIPEGGGSQFLSPGRVPCFDPAAAPKTPRVDALPILRYCREPSRYGRCGPRGAPIEGARPPRRCGGAGRARRGVADQAPGLVRALPGSLALRMAAVAASSALGRAGEGRVLGAPLGTGPRPGRPPAPLSALPCALERDSTPWALGKAPEQSTV